MSGSLIVSLDGSLTCHHNEVSPSSTTLGVRTFGTRRVTVRLSARGFPDTERDQNYGDYDGGPVPPLLRSMKTHGIPI